MFRCSIGTVFLLKSKWTQSKILDFTNIKSDKRRCFDNKLILTGSLVGCSWNCSPFLCTTIHCMWFGNFRRIHCKAQLFIFGWYFIQSAFFCVEWIISFETSRYAVVFNVEKESIGLCSSVESTTKRHCPPYGPIWWTEFRNLSKSISEFNVNVLSNVQMIALF